MSHAYFVIIHSLRLGRVLIIVQLDRSLSQRKKRGSRKQTEEEIRRTKNDGKIVKTRAVHWTMSL